MRRLFNFGRFGTLLFLVVCFVPLSPVLAESYGDLDCTDFGTRERARFEFEKHSFDRYGLDRDGNGDPCEWNPSPGMWPLAAGGAGLLIGRNLGFRKRKGSDFVVPGAKGLFMKWDHRSNGTKVPEFDETALTMAFFGWVPWLGVVVLRDRMLPMSTTPATLLFLAAIIGAVITYLVASMTENVI